MIRARRSGASVIIGLTLACAGHGLEYELQHIPLSGDRQVAFMPFEHGSGTPSSLLVIETPDLDQRQRQRLGLYQEPGRSISLYRKTEHQWERYLHKELDSRMDLVDTVRGAGGMAFAGFQDREVLVLRHEGQRFETLMSAGSMYVGRSWESSPVFEMFVDLNDDDLDDFLMPAFDGWQVAVQRRDGFPQPQVIGPVPEMTWGEPDQFVGYRAETAHRLDANLDGLNDLAFWINGRFEVYLQEPTGTFAHDALILDPKLNDVVGSFMSISIGEGAGEDGGSQRTLDAVGDIDGDGLADLIIQTIEGDGIFGLQTRYEIHRGQVSPEGWLTFESVASSVVSSDGIQLNNERLDLDDDGEQEFVVSSVKITLAAIIGALITRSVPVDVSIYQMSDGRFADEPSFTRRIKVRFDFSEGELFVPAVLSGEVTGDSRTDLLVQRDEESLFVYPGEASVRLFDKTPIKLELDLPTEPEGFAVSDLDRDGRDELILHVRREESAALAVVKFDG